MITVNDYRNTTVGGLIAALTDYKPVNVAMVRIGRGEACCCLANSAVDALGWLS